MATVGAFEAKTHLARLLERVQKGERITITKHGRPIARLVPVDKPDRAARRRTIEALKELRETQSLGGLRVRDLIEEGRR